MTDLDGDAADVQIGFRTQSEDEFQPITLAAGSPPLVGVPSSATPYRVQWDFAADLGGAGYRRDVELQLTVVGGASPPLRAVVEQGNDLPTIGAAAPTPGGAVSYSANTDIEIAVVDTAADEVRVRIEFNADAASGFPESGWRLARSAATPASQPAPEFAIVMKGSIAPGSPTTFRWDTLADLGGRESDVRLRLTPGDSQTSGPAFVTNTFRVDNNLPPQAVFESSSLALGAKRRGHVPISYQLFDPESDPLGVVVQWRGAGQQYPTLPASAAELFDLTTAPSRAAERRALQIATGAVGPVVGRIATLVGLPSNRVRLPELATTAAGLLAEGLAEQTLEVLRPFRLAAPLAWQTDTLEAPVGAMVWTESSSALVLDAIAAGWRLREIDLLNGSVLRDVAAGSGAPSALAADPTRRVLFVASATGMTCLDPRSGATSGTIAHAWGTGPRGLAGIGTALAMATVDDKIVQFDFAASRVTTVIAGLGEPWGIAVDPLEDRLYVADRAANSVRTIHIHSHESRRLPALVPPGEAGTLGTIPFPSPRAIALEQGGKRLLVLCQRGTVHSLRTLDVRSPFSIDGDDVADPFVREVAAGFAAPAGIAAGPDWLRIVALPQSGGLLVGGGVWLRRQIVPEPRSAGDPHPYEPSTQVVTLTAPLPTEAVGTPWRLRSALRLRSAPEGVRHTFVWDTDDVPDVSGVQVRIVPIDSAIGTPISTGPFVALQTPFDVPPVSLASAAVDVAVDDLDGDGDLDLVADGLAFFQTSPRAFSAPISVATGPTLSTADLNADERVDIVSRAGGGIAISLQTPQRGVFTAGPSLASPDARAAVPADLDTDGDLDLASANYGGTLSLYGQGAPGVFTPMTAPLFASSWTTSVVSGDFDTDGAIDLAYAAFGPGAIGVYRQTLPGQFSSVQGILTFPFARQITVGDLDGDGLADLACHDTGMSSEGAIELFFQDGGSLVGSTRFSFANGLAMSGIGIADVDADGDKDVFASDLMLLQTLDGAFSRAPRDPFGGIRQRSVRLADLDGDALVDAVVVNSDGTTSALFQPGPRTLTSSAAALPTAPNPVSVATGDLDGDGDCDLVSLNFDALSVPRSAVLTFYYQTSPGVLTRDLNPLPAAPGGSHIAAADLDGDRDLDLVVATDYFGTANTLQLYFQTSPGTFVVQTAELISGLGPRHVATGDLDGDGDLDIVTGNLSSLSLFFQTAPGVFSTATELPTGPAPFVAPVDMDRDGDLDLVVGNGTYFLQTAPGVFSQAPTSLPNMIGDLVAADLDGDGDVDLAAANGSTMLQTGPGVFTPGPLAFLGEASSLAAIDFDQDGDVDLVTGDRVLLQIAPATFVSVAAAPLPLTGRLALGDLDGDGDTDVVSPALRLVWNGR